MRTMQTEEKTRIGIGVRIGHLTVEGPSGMRKNSYIVWNCRCDCGGSIQLDTRCLQRGTVRDCGCQSRVKPGTKDLTARGSVIWCVSGLLRRAEAVAALCGSVAAIAGTPAWRSVPN